jgi:hypothetical protein
MNPENGPVTGLQSKVTPWSFVTTHQTTELMAMHSLDVVCKEEEVIDLVSDVDEVPQVAAAYKGKVRTPDLGDIIELSD